MGRQDTLQELLDAPDRAALLDWLRQQPLARRHVHGTATETLLLVHAGVLPQWSAQDTLALADEVHAVLRSADLRDFLRQMYGNAPAQWHDGLHGVERLRVIVNALSRLRFCTPQGTMDFRAPKAPASPRRACCPGSTCPGGAQRVSPSRSAIGPRWAGSTAPTCSRSTPAASGAAP